jgi:hypothetical protein
MPCREAVRPTRLANGQLFFAPTSMEQEYRQCDLAPVGYENGIQGLHITGTCIGGLGSPLSRRKGRPDDIPGVTRSMKEDWTRHLGLQSSHPQVPRPSLKPKLEKESEGRLAVAFPRISGGPWFPVWNVCMFRLQVALRGVSNADATVKSELRNSS